jgi:predicted dehydrogenase|tara:strand:- start:433 stop:1347 length:915 start_codon:yes stop_codon:yes gene_type:complete
MVNNKIRIGVIGLGYLGKFHYQKYKANKHVKLTSVVDTDKESYSIIKGKDVLMFEKYQDIVDKVDAVSIVTPTVTHYKLAKFFLDNRVHVLLEKPMTETVAQAKKLNAIAKKNKCVLQIGHLEQFNPAIRKLRKSVCKPQFIEVHRLCQFNPRANDVDVVLDLMIHDIDIVLSIVNKKIESIEVSGKKILTNLTDIANVRIKFKDNIVANLTASRISTKNERKMRIFSNNSYYSIDFINNKLKKIHKDRRNSFKVTDFNFKKTDVLDDEINNFVNTCLGKEKSMTTGTSGLEALVVAKKISKGF